VVHYRALFDELLRPKEALQDVMSTPQLEVQS
jgi:hypothetical protein